ncbi:MAG: hypothetical protein H6545_01660 [Bacteroidales bacterium]|nr:hypothetical protein [Bacteroidales bacterium]
MDSYALSVNYDQTAQEAGESFGITFCIPQKSNKSPSSHIDPASAKYGSSQLITLYFNAHADLFPATRPRVKIGCEI